MVLLLLLSSFIEVGYYRLLYYTIAVQILSLYLSLSHYCYRY